MLNHWTKLLVAGIAGSALAGALWASRTVEAQDAKPSSVRDTAGQAGTAGQQSPDTFVLIYPTGDRATSSLLVEAMTPAEVVVGTPYEYRIQVTNLTKNLVLEDVKIEQTGSESVSIESSKVMGGQGQTDAQSGGRQQGDENNNDGQENAKNQEKAKNQDQGKNQNNDGGEGQGQGSGPWTFDRLGPGESRMIQVTAIGDEEGVAQNCLKVSYEPVLCVATRFVQPEIALAKSAPEQANICRPLELRYLIANRGTGVARGITIRDELPEGLTTGEGKNTIAIEVGDLAAGQEREFRTAVSATDTGNFGSRAVAEGQGVNARSNSTETEIIAPELAVDLTGPSVQYVNEPITYQATVTNDGNAPAYESRLTINAAEQARVLRMSRAQGAESDPERSGRTLSWNLGTIEPGDQRTVSFTVSGRGQGDLEHEAIASSVCARGDDRDEALTVTQAITTEILTIPALVIEMVDRVDPVQVGEETEYHIVVRNQGSGPDQNVQITLNLPENFEFIESRGTTDVQSEEGNSLTFAPIETLQANERGEWVVRVKANDTGDVRTELQVSSEYLQDPVPVIEPTRLID